MVIPRISLQDVDENMGLPSLEDSTTGKPRGDTTSTCEPSREQSKWELLREQSLQRLRTLVPALLPEACCIIPPAPDDLTLFLAHIQYYYGILPTNLCEVLECDSTDMLIEELQLLNGKELHDMHAPMNMILPLIELKLVIDFITTEYETYKKRWITLNDFAYYKYANLDTIIALYTYEEDDQAEVEPEEEEDEEEDNDEFWKSLAGPIADVDTSQVHTPSVRKSPEWPAQQPTETSSTKDEEEDEDDWEAIYDELEKMEDEEDEWDVMYDAPSDEEDEEEEKLDWNPIEDSLMEPDTPSVHTSSVRKSPEWSSQEPTKLPSTIEPCNVPPTCQTVLPPIEEAEEAQWEKGEQNMLEEAEDTHLETMRQNMLIAVRTRGTAILKLRPVKTKGTVRLKEESLVPPGIEELIPEWEEGEHNMLTPDQAEDTAILQGGLDQSL